MPRLRRVGLRLAAAPRPGTTASERQACERTCGAHPSLRGFRCDGIEGASAACSSPTSGAAAEATAAAVLEAIDREGAAEKRGIEEDVACAILWSLRCVWLL